MSATERLLAMLDDGRMSRTDLDPATLAASLRRMVGDGSVEWVTEPMQTRVLLDVADMLDENAKLREQMERLVTLLRVDWDIEASWDGLRRFWYVGLTDEGVRKRDEREATLGRGTMTADDVRDLIERHSDACGGNGRDFHNGAYVAIADELNATLGRGTCHNAAPSYLDFLCSECGFVHYHSDENDSGDGNEWHYCPSCGAEVVDE